MLGYVCDIRCGECAQAMHIEVGIDGIAQPVAMACGTPGCAQRGVRYLAPRIDLTEVA